MNYHNTVDSYLEQVGRRTVTHYAGFDVLSTAFQGPSGTETNAYVPDVGSRHPEFHYMIAVSREITVLPAGIWEVALEYHGTLSNSLSPTWTSPLDVSVRSALKQVTLNLVAEVALSQDGFNKIVAPDDPLAVPLNASTGQPSGVPLQLYRGSAKFAIEFLSKESAVRYFCFNPPVAPQFGGFTQRLNTLRRMVLVDGSIGPLRILPGTPVLPLQAITFDSLTFDFGCVDFSAKFDGALWEVTETFGSELNQTSQPNRCGND